MPRPYEFDEDTIERMAWAELHRERQERQKREEKIWRQVHKSATAGLQDEDQDSDNRKGGPMMFAEMPIPPEFDSDEEF